MAKIKVACFFLGHGVVIGYHLVLAISEFFHAHNAPKFGGIGSEQRCSGRKMFLWALR